MDMQTMNIVEEPSKCVKLLQMFWQFCTCVFSHVTLVCLVVGYCLIGAYTFQSLEKDNEIMVKNSISKLRANITESLWVLTYNFDVLIPDNWTRAARKELKRFETDLLGKMEREGWDGSESLLEVQWTLSGALFYSIIVITTIGYGHIAPRTKYGKVVTIFYAILGIPLMLLCLSSIGDVMASSFRFLYWKVCCYVCTKPPRKRRPRNSTRSTLRQSGRYSNRTAGSSFRRSVRASERSADSAIGLSDSMGRSSYLNMDYRYNIDGMDLATDFRCTRPSTMSRYSDIPVSSPKVKGGRLTSDTASLDRRAIVDQSEANRIPILFNKYALEDPEDEHPNEEEIGRGRGRGARGLKGVPKRSEMVSDSDLGEESLRRNRMIDRRDRDRDRDRDRGSSVVRNNNESINDGNNVGLGFERVNNFRRHLSQPPPDVRHDNNAPVTIDIDSMMKRRIRMRRAQSYYAGRNNQRRDIPSPRTMSPMGFATLQRQNYDDFEIDYDYAAEDSGMQVIKPVPIWLCVFLVVSYIFGGAFLFSHWENWTFLDSAYFCFITLTTIGFGDLVPKHRLNAEISIALCSLYLLFGIALLAMSFNLVQEEVINNVKTVAKKLGIIKDDEDNYTGYNKDRDDDDYYDEDEEDED